MRSFDKQRSCSSRLIRYSWIARVLFVAFLVLSSVLTIREPLWIDELHTLWSISGNWQDVLDRSTVGNQSPFYFVCIKVYCELIGLTAQVFGVEIDRYSTTVLRLSSILGWGVLAWLLSGVVCRIPSNFMAQESATPCETSLCDKSLYANFLLLIIGAIWLASDRIGVFYSNEVRPYVWVAVAGILLINQTAPTNRFSVAWIASCCVAFYLHYTSIFIVVLSWLIRMFHASIGGATGDYTERLVRLVPKKTTIIRLAEGTALAIFMVPGLAQLLSLYGSASKWAYFAGECDIMTLLRIIPWFAWIGIPGLVVLLRRTWQWGSRTSIIRLDFIPILLVTTCVVTNWFLCVMGWAPLMHSRYLMVVYPAVWISGIGLLSSLDRLRWIVMVGLIAFGVNGWLQGSWPLWIRGNFIAWQRTEDWGKAVRVLQEKSLSGDVLLFAPMLIETQDQQEIDSASEQIRRYFTFAWKAAMFQNHSSTREHNYDVYVLSNKVNSWSMTLNRYRKTIETSSRPIWILARTNIDLTLSSITDDKQWEIEVIYRSGNLQLWQIRLPK